MTWSSLEINNNVIDDLSKTRTLCATAELVRMKSWMSRRTVPLSTLYHLSHQSLDTTPSCLFPAGTRTPHDSVPWRRALGSELMIVKRVYLRSAR